MLLRSTHLETFLRAFLIQRRPDADIAIDALP
jgi:hypothetical protein